MIKHQSIEFLFLQQILPWFRMKSISILIFAALIMLGKFYWSHCYLLPTIGSINFSDTWKIKFNFFISGAADHPDLSYLSICCINAGVPEHCMGLCTPVRSVARSLGNRINACTKYDKDIEKCWEHPNPKPDKIGELL